MQSQQNFKSIDEQTKTFVASKTLSNGAADIHEPGRSEIERSKNIVWVDFDKSAALSQILRIDATVLPTHKDLIKIASSDQPAAGEIPDLILPPEASGLLEGRTLFVTEPGRLVKGDVVRHLQASNTVLCSIDSPLEKPEIERIQLAASLARTPNVGCVYSANTSPETIAANSEILSSLNVDSYVLTGDEEENTFVASIQTAAHQETVSVLKTCVAELLPEIDANIARLETEVSNWQVDLEARRQYEAFLEKQASFGKHLHEKRVPWRTEAEAMRAALKKIRSRIEADLKPFNGGPIARKLMQHIDRLKWADFKKNSIDATVHQLKVRFKEEVASVLQRGEEQLQKRVYTRGQESMQNLVERVLREVMDTDEWEVTGAQLAHVEMPSPNLSIETWEVKAKIFRSRHVFTLVVATSIGASIGATIGGVIGTLLFPGPGTAAGASTGLSTGAKISAAIGATICGLGGAAGGGKVVRDEETKAVKEKLKQAVTTALGEIRNQVSNEIREQTPIILQSISNHRDDIIAQIQSALEKEKALLEASSYTATEYQEAITDAEAEIAKLQALKADVDDFCQ